MPRLDRHISAHTGANRKDVRLMLAQGRITVDGCIATDTAQVINQFSHVTLDGKTTQAKTAHYLKLNKPKGVVCATKDAEHTTVIDLIDKPWKGELHIAGRLDYNSTGLVLLSNDGQWTRKLSLPGNRLPKRYRVRTEQRILPAYVHAFEEGMYFDFEDITTRPSQLKILSEFEAEVTLVEGRYHQIKRMFGQFDNKVLELHRFAIGDYELGDLQSGQSKILVTS